MADGVLEARLRAILGDVGTPSTAELTQLLKDNLGPAPKEIQLQRVGPQLYRTSEPIPTGWACAWTGYPATVTFGAPYPVGTLLEASAYTIDPIAREVSFAAEVDWSLDVYITVWSANLYWAAADWLERISSDSSKASQVIAQGNLKVQASASDSLTSQAADFRAKGTPPVASMGELR